MVVRKFHLVPAIQYQMPVARIEDLGQHKEVLFVGSYLLGSCFLVEVDKRFVVLHNGHTVAVDHLVPTQYQSMGFYQQFVAFEL
jgi:hypothetical protein